MSIFIEDKYENAVAGLEAGLKPILVEHGFNMNEPIPEGMVKCLNWRGIYEHITGNLA